MCDERERLLDYLYDVCDGDERRRVDDHLAACPECRAEIGGLRSVRQDLLAWDVPEHGSVWKPFAPARSTPWWREVPVWALAAAASVMFLLGLGGGLAARALTPVQAAAAPPVLQAPPAATSADVAAMEQRIMSVVQAQVDRRLEPIAAHVQPVSQAQINRQMQSLLADSEGRQQQATTNAVLMMLRDYEKNYVRQSDFKTFLNRDLPDRMRWEVAQALLQQGGK